MPGVTAVVRDGRSRRSSVTVRAAGAAAAAGVVAIAAVLLVTAPWADRGEDRSTGGPAAGTSATRSATNRPCHYAHETVLPSWATAGFGDPEPVVMHATGDSGNIVAVLFGRVLHAPPAKTVNNKILWVVRESGAEPLRIEAVLDGSGRTVHRRVAGGPGPSIVDLPQAGCWHLTLDWGPAPDRRDTMDLVYVDPGPTHE
jgi:hypothetical protein